MEDSTMMGESLAARSVIVRITICASIFTAALIILTYYAPLDTAWVFLLTYCGAAIFCVLATVLARFRPKMLSRQARQLRRLLGPREVPGLPTRVAAVTVLIGATVGAFYYFTQITVAQRELLVKIMNANVIERILRETPYYPVEAEQGEIDTLAFVTILERLSLIRDDIAPEELFGQESHFSAILPNFFRRDVTPCGGAGRGIVARNTTTLNVVACLARAQGLAQSGNGPQQDDEVINLMAAVLARRAGAWHAENSTFRTDSANGRRVWFVRDPPVSDRNLLNGVYEYVGAYKANSTLRTTLRGCCIADFPPTMPAEAAPNNLRVVANFQLALLGELHRDPNIAEARATLDIWLGYEQFAIVVLAFVLASLLLARWTYAMPNFTASWFIYQRIEAKRVGASASLKDRLSRLEEIQREMDRRFRPPDLPTVHPQSVAPLWVLDGAFDDLHELVRSGTRLDTRGARVREQIQALNDSRTGLTFAYNALPALGFLGTVHGILGALGNSGSITSTDRLEQAAGISLVSSSLGLAFSTTLIALAASLALGFFDMLLHRMERLSIIELGRKLHLEYLS